MFLIRCIVRQLVLLLLFADTCFSACAVCPADRTIWFVNNANPLTGDGSYNNPFSNLQIAIATAGDCDLIYVFPGDSPYDAQDHAPSMGQPFSLKPNQRLLSTTLEAFQLCPQNCSLPVLTNTQGDAVINLSNNNQVSGFIISPDTRQFGPLGIAADGISQATISHNVLLLSHTGLGISVLNCPQLDVFTVQQCSILGTDNTQNQGIHFIQSANGIITITQNVFGGTSSGSLNMGIFITRCTGDNEYFIAENSFSFTANPSGSAVGILFYTQMSTGKQTAVVTDNQIVMTADSLPAGGIAFLNDLTPACLTLHNNTVSTPVNFPGYFIWNISNVPFLLDFDNSNKGVFLVNATTPNSPLPAPPSFTPINPTCPLSSLRRVSETGKMQDS